MRTKSTKGTELLLLAANRLRDESGIGVDVASGRNHEAARLVLGGPNGPVELLAEVHPTFGGATAIHLAQTTPQHILVTDYVNPVQAQRLRSMGVQFLDCAGNVYVNTGSVFLFVQGNRPESSFRVRPARLFKPGGLQFAFALLCSPDLAGASYRTIADAACVSLGTVAWAMADLQKQGYLVQLGNRGRRLVGRSDLLRKWLVGYEQLLRPRLMGSRYHTQSQSWWQDADIGDALWGGEVAALKMTGHLKPERVTVFAPRLPGRLMLQYQLRLDPQGEVEVLTPFWTLDYPEKKAGLVPPLLVYADLAVRTDGRTTETAMMVYERYLARHFKED